MLEENIQYLIEKVDLLTKLVYELKNMTTPNEQSSVSNQHVLTDIQGAIRITGRRNLLSTPMHVKASSLRIREVTSSTSTRMNSTNGLKVASKTAMASILKRCSMRFASKFATCPVVTANR